MNTSKLLDVLKEKEIESSLAIKRHNALKLALRAKQKELVLLERAKAIVINLGELTQKNAKEKIEKIVLMALQCVFVSEYDSFILEFDDSKRDQLELHFKIRHRGIFVEPRQDTIAGGALDICSFAMKIINLQWEMNESGCSPILFLDEPFKNISGGYLDNAFNFINMISDLMGIQTIMVTHVDSFIERADNVILLNSRIVNSIVKHTLKN